MRFFQIAFLYYFFGFFYGFFGTRLKSSRMTLSLNLGFDLRLGATFHMECDFRNRISVWIFDAKISRTKRVILKTFKESTRGRLGTTQEDFKTTCGVIRIPSSLVMIQVLLEIEACRTQGRLGTTRGYLQDYLEHCTQLQSTRGLVDRASLGPPTHCGTYSGDGFLHNCTTRLVGHGVGIVDHKARQGGQGLVLRPG
jgi:hypothetical protein